MMFIEDEPLCLFPVRASDALAWARGQLSDLDLTLRAPLSPEAIFIVNLPSRGAYRQCLRQILHYHRLGAVCLIARTNNLTVATHIIAQGQGLVTHQEHDTGKVRLFSPPDAFLPWIAKIARGLSPKTPSHLGA